MAADYKQLMDSIRAKYGEKNIPISVQFEITKACNLDCRHCYVDHDSKGKELSTGELVALFDEVREFGTLILCLTGGEPFLRPDIWELIEAATERRFYLKIFTNGNLLTEASVGRLKELSTGEVHISIYSLNPEVHDSITGQPGSLEKSLRAIGWLKAAGITIKAKTPLMRSNLKDLSEVVAWTKREGISNVYDLTIIPAENNVRDCQAENLTMDELFWFFSDPSNRDVIMDGKENMNPCDAFGKNRHRSEGTICTIGRQFFIIDAYGDFQPCALYPSIGNVRETGFRDLWHSEELERLRGISYETQTDCPDCPELRFCIPCPAMAKIEGNGDRGCATSAKRIALTYRRIKDWVEKESGKVG